MKIADMRAKEESDLKKELDARRAELLELRFQHAMGALENPARMGQVKRQIAQLLTVLGDRSRKAAKAGATDVAVEAGA